MSNWKIIENESGYKVALERTIKPDTDEFEELELLLVLVKNYEDQHIKLDL